MYSQMKYNNDERTRRIYARAAQLGNQFPYKTGAECYAIAEKEIDETYYSVPFALEKVRKYMLEKAIGRDDYFQVKSDLQTIIDKILGE